MKKDYMKVFIRTFGCQMNESDSEIVYAMLLSQGYVKAKSYEDANVILFNTCSVRQHAEDRIWGNVGELKKLKDKTKVLGIIGCMAQAQGKEIFKRLGHVNFICGPSDIYEIIDLIERARDNPKERFSAISKIKRPLKTQYSIHNTQYQPYREDRIRGFVNISYGCNNFCSYCIVPYVRGREISRPAKDIIDEVKMLVEDGAKEIMLLGQNVNSFGKRTEGREQRTEFVKLLEKINKIDGLLRIRFMTSHPKDANAELFKAMRDLDKVCEHLHLPLQSGSDRILGLMNRKYTSGDYLKLVEQYRKIVDNGSITTDIIVGFPTESEDDFYKTYMLLKDVKFDGVFIFKYSPRPRAVASKMTDDISKQTKEERHQKLLALQDRIIKDKNKLLVGSIQQVLGMNQAKRPPQHIKGRTRQNALAIYKGSSDLIGRLSDVKIKCIEGNTLIGEIA